MADKYVAPVHMQVAAELQTAIKEKRIDVHNAMALVAHGMQMMDRFKGMSGVEKSQHLLQVLEDIAKGPDGDWGTQDDLLPPIVWNGVKTLIESGMIQSTIDVISQLKKGTFPSAEVQKCAIGCFGILKSKA